MRKGAWLRQGLGAIVGLFIAAAAQAQTQRIVTADMQQTTGPRDAAALDCVGADHPGILLRPANLAQLKLAHDELGFRYIRFHGILHDDMGAYREENGKPIYNFDKIDAVYGAIVGLGMKPFVEIGFMPSALASDTKTIFYWKGNGSPPKDWKKWSDFMAAFARHLETRFGRAEVQSWRFEVWNEPNLDGFWTGGNQANYFKLYDVTVGALKGVDPALKVGGPSTAGTAWVPEFLAHAKATGVPVDFVTTHAYGVDAGFLDEKGEGDNKLSANPGAISNDVWRVRQQIQADWPGLPLYFTEWSTSYNPRDPVHDDYLSAAYILDKVKKTAGGAQSMSYWTYTDLFEEAGPPPSSFHGGFGLINREGVRKAAFFAYKYLHQLGPVALAGEDRQSLLTREGRNFSGVFWDYETPAQLESNRPFYRKDRPPVPAAPIDLTVKNLTPGTYRLTLHTTGYRANDAYTQYIAWGRPTDLTAEQIAALQALSADKPVRDETVVVGRDGTLHRSIALRSNDVVLVQLAYLSP